MMVNKKEQKAHRIPVRFIGDKGAPDGSGPDELKAAEPDQDSRQDENEPSTEELGRASSYEDETEMKRRIDRGTAGEGAADDERGDEADTAGGPPADELPERREEQHQAGGAGVGSAESARDSTPPPRSVDAAVGPMLAELVATRAELKRVEAANVELQDKLARRQADFENYRKRVERERTETYNRMVGDVVARLLPVLDNFRRALDTAGSLQGTESGEFRHFLEGVELIYKQLGDVLEGLGLEAVAAVGQPFDPHIHEAVVTEQTDEYEPDTVMQELVRGYRLGDKLLRPAMVKVATR